jgi:hypothetical protein
MAQEIVLKLIVEDGQVEQAVAEIEKLGGSIEKVNDTTVKTGKTLGDSMDSAGQATKNLKDGVEGAARQVRVLGRAAKISGKAMRSALIATGIGAFVVLLGIVVDNWEAIGEAIGFINRDFEKQNQLLQDNTKLVNSRLSLLNKEINFNKLRDKSNKENLKYQKDLLLEKKKLLAENILLLETQLATAKSQATELSLWQKFLGRTKAKGDVGIIDEEEKENIDALTLQLNKLKEAAIDVESILNPPETTTPTTKEARGQISAISFGGETGISDPYNEQKEKDAKSLQALREGTEEFAIAQNERLDIEVEALFKSAEIATQKTAIEKQASEERIAQAKAEADAKVGFEEILLKSTLSSLRSISMLFEEGTAASKAAAIAEIVIGTGVGFIQALDIAQKGAKATGPAAPFAFPIFYATQVAAVLSAASQAKNILSQTKGGDGGLGSINVAGGNGGQAPSFNVVGTGGVTQSQFQESLQAEDTPIRAYVVSGDVTSSQEFDRNVEDSSSIG